MAAMDNPDHPTEEKPVTRKNVPLSSFLAVVGSEQFDKLPVEAVCSVLCSETLAVRDEVEVFLAGVKWLVGDWDRRRTHAWRVIRCVQFDRVAPAQIVEIRGLPGNPEFNAVTAVPEVALLLDEGLRYSLRRQYYLQWPDERCCCVECINLLDPPRRNYIGGRPLAQFITFQDFLHDLEIHRKEGKADSDDQVEETGQCDASVAESKSPQCDNTAIEINCFQCNNNVTVINSFQYNNTVTKIQSSQCDNFITENKSSQFDNIDIKIKNSQYDTPITEIKNSHCDSSISENMSSYYDSSTVENDSSYYDMSVTNSKMSQCEGSVNDNNCDNSSTDIPFD